MNILDRIGRLSKAEQVCYGLGAFCLLIGLFFNVSGLVQIVNANASNGWPHTTGKVTKSQVDVTSHTTKDSGGRRSTYVTYSAIIRYQYLVGNKTYMSQQVSFSNPSAVDSIAEQRASRYPVGARVTVYYASDNPGTAVLEPGITPESFALSLFGLMFVVAGVICAVIGFRFSPYLRRGGGTYRLGQLDDGDDDLGEGVAQTQLHAKSA